MTKATIDARRSHCRGTQTDRLAGGKSQRAHLRGAQGQWKRLYFVPVLVLLAGILAGCSPSNRPVEKDAAKSTLSFKQVRAAASQMAGAIRKSAKTIASFGPRQTGQVGCQRTYELVRSTFADLDAAVNPDHPSLRDFSSEVTVPLDRHTGDDTGDHTSLTLGGLDGGRQVWPVSAFYPNNVQDCLTRPEDETPRRLVDLGQGRWEDFDSKSVAHAVVLLDYNSADAWLRARQLGAYGAIFIQPEWTNWRQSDLKYLAMVPLYMPRVYVDADRGHQLRAALQDGRDIRVTLRSRLRWRNVDAPCVEFTIPGKDPKRTFILVTHFDARSIVPDLAYGGDEIWGVAAMMEMAKFYARPENRPSVNLRFIAVSGLYQAQRTTRDYVALGTRGYNEIGKTVQLVMGLDYSTEGADLNLIGETAWAGMSQQNYLWIKKVMFSEGGWYQQIQKGLNLQRRDVEFYAGGRPFMIGGGDSAMAPARYNCPFTYAPKFPTANEVWAAVNAPTFAFQTARLYRLTHNSPLDRFAASNTSERFANLEPQLEITLALLDRFLQYPSRRIPHSQPLLKRRAGYNAYVQMRGRIQAWDPQTGWFSEKMPEAPAPPADADATATGTAETASAGTTASDGREKLRTFVYAVSSDAKFYQNGSARERAYLGWPLAPSRRGHRELQSFMFDELRMLDKPQFSINALYNSGPKVQVDVLGYALDDQGHILYATDYGVHGDGDPAFQCTDVHADYWDLFVPVTLFPCGSVELYDLTDIERHAAASWVFGQFYISWSGDTEDRGIQPFVRVTAVKNADSHTDMRSWGCVQYGPTAMVFLPASKPSDVDALRAEILLGSRLGKFTPLLDTDKNGVSHGYAVSQGETIRVNADDQLAAAAYAQQTVLVRLSPPCRLCLAGGRQSSGQQVSQCGQGLSGPGQGPGT